MTAYLWIKLLHIVSATILFGTGLGIASFMLRAYVSENTEAIKVTARNVVIADWIFTTPAVVIQLVTGIWLVYRLGIPFNSAWFISVIGLFILVGACWIPVVRIQIRIRDMMDDPQDHADYRKLMRIWIALGIPAFFGVLILFFLMVSRIGTNRVLFGQLDFTDCT